MKATVKILGLSLLSLGLAGCASTGPDREGYSVKSSDSRYQTLYDMDTPPYFAMVRLAATIDDACPAISKNLRLNRDLNTARYGTYRGGLTRAILFKNAIDREAKSLEAGFREKHGGDLCAGGLFEIVGGVSPLSALLFRTGAFDSQKSTAAKPAPTSQVRTNPAPRPQPEPAPAPVEAQETEPNLVEETQQKPTAVEHRPTAAPRSTAPAITEATYDDPRLAKTVGYSRSEIQVYCSQTWRIRQLANGEIEINPCYDRRYQ